MGLNPNIPLGLRPAQIKSPLQHQAERQQLDAQQQSMEMQRRTAEMNERRVKLEEDEYKAQQASQMSAGLLDTLMKTPPEQQAQVYASVAPKFFEMGFTPGEDLDEQWSPRVLKQLHFSAQKGMSIAERNAQERMKLDREIHEWNKMQPKQAPNRNKEELAMLAAEGMGAVNIPGTNTPIPGNESRNASVALGLLTPPKEESAPKPNYEQAQAIAALEEKLGRKPTASEINQDMRAQAKNPNIYSAYQYIDGYNPDGSPIVKYGGPEDVRGKEAPKTFYGPDNMPTTGSARGYATSPSPALPEGTQVDLSGLSTSIEMIDTVLPQIQNSFSAFGPASGRIKNIQMNNIGGAGLSPEEVKLATNLRRLLTVEAFSNGGKQLTGTELEQYKKLLPDLNDEFGTAIIKAQQAREYLVKRMTQRLRFVPPRQQGQLPDTPIPGSQGGSAPARPRGVPANAVWDAQAQEWVEP